VHSADTRWVLIAEDDGDIRKIIKDTLEAEAGEMDLRVVEAVDGLDALSKATHRLFHCVVTDLKMPKSTGDEFIRAMQSHPLNANTPTLVVSAYTQDEFKEFCDSCSHIKVIPKPFEPLALAAAILKEVRLGRIDETLSVQLVHPFVGAAQEVVERDFGLTVELTTPSIKKVGETLSGDVHCSLTISTGALRTIFTLSFDRELLEFTKKHFEKHKINHGVILTLESIAHDLCRAIFTQASSAVHQRMGGTPLAKTVVIESGTPAYQDLCQGAGVTMSVRTLEGRIHAGAFSISKSQRD
jgi:two-component system chemotaxis response regulator CheY